MAEFRPPLQQQQQQKQLLTISFEIVQEILKDNWNASSEFKICIVHNDTHPPNMAKDKT